MQQDSLGAVVARFRTSRVQALVLFLVAVVLAGLAVYFYFDKLIGTPIALICGPASLYFLGWAYTLAVPVLEIREYGVTLRGPIRTVHLHFSQIASIAKRQRTVNGLPGSANGIVFERSDGSEVVFHLESNVDEAIAAIVQQSSAGPRQATNA